MWKEKVLSNASKSEGGHFKMHEGNGKLNAWPTPSYPGSARSNHRTWVTPCGKSGVDSSPRDDAPLSLKFISKERQIQYDPICLHRFF